MKHVISALVENEFGVLARIAGLFSGRGYNIQSLTVAETQNPKFSRMTIVTDGSDSVMEQIIKQLDKLVNVIRVADITKEKAINRVLGLVKIAADKKTASEIKKKAPTFGGEILSEDSQCLVIEIRGNEENLEQAVKKLKPYGILEFEKTGNIAMQKGRKVMA
ncbi:MAG: acetolactate synthase small subunit [Deltaproteobacteria bacterium]|nr:acetolactate synthase small subunit [Deltaproteobacteria bacterium]